MKSAPRKQPLAVRGLVLVAWCYAVEAYGHVGLPGAGLPLPAESRESSDRRAVLFATAFAPDRVGYSSVIAPQKAAADRLASYPGGRAILVDLALHAPTHARLHALLALGPRYRSVYSAVLPEIRAQDKPITFFYGCILSEEPAHLAADYLEKKPIRLSYGY